MESIIIIPAYNEQDNILDVINDIEQNAPGYHYMVINDGSTDKTGLILRQNHIPHINLPFNIGIGGAVQTGYKYAFEKGYDIVIQFDGDGQHKASFITEMINIIEDGNADMVIGSRFLDKKGYQSTFIRRLGIKYFRFLIWLLSGSGVTDSTSGFRACNRKIIELFSKNYPQDYPEPESIMILKQKKLRVTEVPVEMKKRARGNSSINRSLSVYYMVKVTLAIILSRMRPRIRRFSN
ncbi:glycosyl transferase family 2 [Ruminiclostridium papyrosolvens DSM 2782]|uniref:Glycosyl transferase family 2 n=1 Tax=Ruminiclostridium papyrosolvens DSM 2782 TaxID=588581 RepID=F1TFE7_9FIRM|nr:glycosyltransferase family 2 protein [Ruminiclostridium papyrosolvens]EGD46871.1 glycosyl transferase family 2 [Ruminiclostridium papyrosolvens DSM 2782]WES34356.1 glycosyltransferase family 2 protein [Ruminiclostridium papyrosolvens DSM 2782]